MVTLDPDRLQVYGLLMQLYPEHREGRRCHGIAFAISLSGIPRSIPGHTLLGMLLQARRRLPEAETHYRQVLAVDPRAAVAANNLAWLYVETNRDLHEALQLAQTSWDQLPNDARVNDTLGWIYYLMNKPQAAIPFLEASVAADPADPSAHYHLGLAYKDARAYLKATRALERALQIKSDFDGASDARKKLTELGG